MNRPTISYGWRWWFVSTYRHPVCRHLTLSSSPLCSCIPNMVAGRDNQVYSHWTAVLFGGWGVFKLNKQLVECGKERRSGVSGISPQISTPFWLTISPDHSWTPTSKNNASPKMKRICLPQPWLSTWLTDGSGAFLLMAYSSQWPSVYQLLKWITLNPGCWGICTTCSGSTTLTDTRPDGKPIVQVLRSCCLGHVYTFDNHHVSPVRLCVMHRDGLCRLEHTGPRIYTAHMLLGDPGRLPCYHIKVSSIHLDQSRLVLLDPSTRGIPGEEEPLPWHHTH